MRAALALDMEIQRRIDLLDDMLVIAAKHGHHWVCRWLEQEILQLEAEQLAMLQDEVEKNKQPPARATESRSNNLIIPSVPHWKGECNLMTPDTTTQWDFDREAIEAIIGVHQLVLLEALLIAHNWAADAINGKAQKAEALKYIYDHTHFVLKLVGAKVMSAADAQDKKCREEGDPV